jgi:hypothetical protein
MLSVARKQGLPNAATNAIRDTTGTTQIVSPYHGDRMVDALVVQSEHQQD